jgi:hypothetical protein
MGPGELLRRLAVNQLSAGGRMNSARFFSLDASARQDFLSRPENSEAVLENRRNQAALSKIPGVRGTDIEIGQQFAKNANDIGGLRANIRPDVPSDLRQAALAANDLKALSDSTLKLSDQFDKLADRVSEMFNEKNNGPPNPASPAQSPIGRGASGTW